MTKWLTADWHFGHRNILTLGAGRPFTTIEEHDETLVERHNALVAPDDEVWVLGDVAMGNIAESLARCARMNGRKVLVCGNHDRPAMTDDQGKRRAWTERYMDEGGFAGVFVLDLSAHRCTIGLPAGVLVSASHYPYAGESEADRPNRYADRRPIDRGLWLVHGHVHDQWRVNGRQINVGVDVWNFAPVSVNTVVDLIRSIQH